ncbi:hypothetical protein [Nocardia asteroides]|uniref:hypothetical protein n=1 Tax=Nocardia asteroides TaxID=1824 RepID=UPI00364EB0F5
MTTIRLERAAGLVTLVPPDAPTVLDAAPALDVLVLDVLGGHLSWSLLAGQTLPAAVLDDPDAAQDWLWAVYGESVALAVADGQRRALDAEPARAELVESLRRLAYAHWAARWWPASTIDDIPALDPALLATDIAELAETCEIAIADPSDDLASSENFTASTGYDLHSAAPHTSTANFGADPAASSGTSAISGDGSGTNVEAGAGAVDDDAVASGTRENRGRADDYALAAGGDAGAGGLVLGRGSTGWDWRRCPPGLLDAGDQAVSWQVTRADGVSTVRISVVAAPDSPRDVDAHLRPHARLTTGSSATEVALRHRGDAWLGAAQLTEVVDGTLSVDVFVPGVGPADPRDEAESRHRIRAFARARLLAPGAELLRAEAAAAENDSDF